MRRALVIASEFGAPEDERLEFVPDLANSFAGALTDQWECHGVVLNPTAKKARAAIRAEVKLAAQQQETLLLLFIGHGATRASQHQTPDFYLQYRKSSPEPTTETSLSLIPFLKEALGESSALGINGLVLLVDACSAGGVPVQAALSLDNPIGTRLEVLVASDSGNAYNGCFTRTLTDILNKGIAHAGETIHPANVLPELSTLCPTQSPAHLSYTNGYLNTRGTHDPALWLMPNRTRAWHALLGRPDAGLLDQVTDGVTLSRNQRVALREIEDRRQSRLRVVTGPAGTGKTTLLASLVNTQQDRFGQVSASDISAAVFLNRITTASAAIGELASQLGADPLADPDTDGNSIRAATHRFADVHRQVQDEIKASRTSGPVDVLERELILPLARFLDPTDAPVQIVIDGLDQVHPDHVADFLRVISRLTTDDRLDRLRIIVGLRATDRSPPKALAGAEAVTITPPNWGDLPAGQPEWLATVISAEAGEPIPGGWLTVRLLSQLDEDPGGYDLTTAARAFFNQAVTRLDNPALATIASDITQLLSVTGIGPVLPLVVLKQALVELGHEASATELATILAILGPLTIRGRAGFPDEHLGLAHLEISRALTESSDA